MRPISFDLRTGSHRSSVHAWNTSRPIRIALAASALAAVVLMTIDVAAARAGVLTEVDAAPLIHGVPTPPHPIPDSEINLRPGAHVDYYLDMKFTYTDALGMTGTAGADAEDVGSVHVEPPEGGFGDPSAIPPEFECDLQAIHGDDIDPTIEGEQKWPPPHHPPAGYFSECPASSRVGEVTINAKLDVPLLTPTAGITGSVYMMKTPDRDNSGQPDEEIELPAYLGISMQPSPLIPASIADVRIEFISRTKTDYGLHFSNPVSRIPGIQIQQILFRFFGLIDTAGNNPGTHDHANEDSHEIHFVTNPTRCTPWVTQVFTSGHDSNPDSVADFDNGEVGDNHGPDGTPDHTVASDVVNATDRPPWCDEDDLAPFAPELQTQSSDPDRGDPTGFSVQIDNPTSEDGAGESNRDQHPPQLKKLFTTLPQGLELNPAAANAINDLVQQDRNADGDPDFCLPEEFDKADHDSPSTCPRNAAGDNDTGTDIGDVEIYTPLLSLPLKGDVFLGDPEPDPSDRYKLYVEAAGAVRVKLEGRVFVSADGRITSVFGDPASDHFLPQAPADQIRFDFKNGPRAPLANPRHCGEYETTIDATPWTAPHQDNATATGSFEINGPCGPEPFAPTADIDVSTTQAGAHPDLDITIVRPRGDQQLKGFELKLPGGLMGSLDAVPLCDDADADTGNCGASSQVGTLTAEIGPGTETAQVSGKLYMAEADQPGDVASLLAVVRAKVGPYDLGDVISRTSIRLRGDDYGIHSITADLPRRVEGIENRIQQLKIRLDGVASTGKAMITNPTSCAAKQLLADFESFEGGEASDTDAFQATDCGSLHFEPGIVASSSSPAAGSPTGLDLEITNNPATTDPDGRYQANFKRLELALPAGMQINPSAANALTDEPATPNRDGDPEADGCLPSEFNRADPDSPASCPRNAAGDNNTGTDIGDVTVHNALLPLPLTGDIFLGDPGSTAADRYKLLIELRGMANIKLEGRALTDAAGNVTSVFGDPSVDTFIPDAPTTKMEIRLRDDARAPLTNPDACGSPDLSAKFTPWASPDLADKTVSNAITVDQDCTLDPFAPTFGATVSTSEAGAHPDLDIDIARPDGQPLLRDMTIKLPRGLVGSLTGSPLCASADAAAGSCSAEAKVGTIGVKAGSGEDSVDVTGDLFIAEGVGAQEPASLLAKVRAKVGPFDLGDVLVRSRIKLRGSSDYGIDAITVNLPRIVDGVPTRIRELDIHIESHGTTGKPFMTNSTSCSAREFVAQFASYNGDNASATAPYTPTACDTLPFQPTLTASSSSADAGAPTGLSVEYANPAASSDDSARYAPPFKRIDVTLPAGMEINPAAANAFNSLANKNRDGDPDTDGCLPAEFNRDDPEAPAACPRNPGGDNNTGTDIADVEVTSPLLPVPLKGDIFLGDPGATNADRFKLLLEVRGPVDVKLEGRAVPDANGRITSVFGDPAVGGPLPELPYTNLKVVFKGGPQAPLTNPQICGTHTISSRVTPWSTPDQAAVNLSDGFSVSGSCGGGFGPGFAADVSTTQATAHPDLNIHVTRPDRHELIRSMRFSLPAGLVGSEGAVPTCTNADADSGNCPAETKVGEVNVGAGSGPELARVSGDLFMAPPLGPGEPASLALKVRAKVGPYDLGNVLLRTRIFLRDGDKGLDSLTVDIPRILEGVPTRIRDLNIRLYGTAPSTGKPFMYNASSCAPNQFGAVFTSWDGTESAASAPYQATGCESTSFAPSLAMTLDSSKRKNTPASSFNVKLPAGDANIKRTVVSFPPAIRTHIDGLGKPCDLELRDAQTCPPETQIGTVTATTPLLSVPLTGPVHLVRGTPLPGLAVYLRGPVAVRLDATNRTDPSGRLVSTFDNIPDLAVSDFTINLRGGDRGILETRECPIENAPAKVVFESHSGKMHEVSADPKLDQCAKATSTKSSFKITRSKSGLGFKLSVRQDEGPDLAGATIRLPKGMKLKKPRNWKRLWGKIIRGTAKSQDCGSKTKRLKGGSLIKPRGKSGIAVKTRCDARLLTVTARNGTVQVPRSLKRKLKSAVKRCNRRKGSVRRKCITRLAPTFRARIQQTGKDRTVRGKISASRAAR